MHACMQGICNDQQNAISLRLTTLWEPATFMQVERTSRTALGGDAGLVEKLAGSITACYVGTSSSVRLLSRMYWHPGWLHGGISA